MAKETITRLVDDLDGSAASRTVRFSWNGVGYEIDLSAKNSAAFENALGPYLQAARRGSAPARKSARVRLTKPVADLAAVRSWAKEHGHAIADRGRIPRAVIEAFDAAQSGSPVTTRAASRPQKTAAATRSPGPRPRKTAAKKTAARKAPARKPASKR